MLLAVTAMLTAYVSVTVSGGSVFASGGGNNTAVLSTVHVNRGRLEQEVRVEEFTSD